MRTLALILLVALLVAVPASARLAPVRPAPEATPSVRWAVDVDSPPRPDRALVLPGGLLVEDVAREGVLLDTATGAVNGSPIPPCNGEGPATVDVSITDRREGEGEITGAQLIAQDERTAFFDRLLLDLETGGRPMIDCRVLGGYGDLALAVVTTQEPSNFRPTTRLFGVRVTDALSEQLWMDFLARCPSVLAGLSEPAPQVADGMVVRFMSGCDAFQLTAVDLRTGEVVAEEPVDVGRGTVIPSPPGARASVLVATDPATAYDLVPAPGGLAWVERWTAPVGDGLGAGGGVVLTRDPASGLVDVVDAGTGAVRWSEAGLVNPRMDSEGTVVALDGDDLVAVAPDGARRWTLADLGAAIGKDVSGQVHVLGFGPDRAVYLAGVPASGSPWVARLDPGDTPEPGRVLRVDAGDDPIDIAVAACRRIAPTYQQASRVLIGRSDVFADALAGAALAGPDGCILYVDGGPAATLDARTLYETARVLPAGGRVYVLGGEQAVSAGIVADLAATGYDVVRLAGASRIETAVEVAREVAALAPTPPTTAYLATAGNFPDAVTAGAHAARAGVPMLLSGVDQLSGPAADALAELGITRTVLLGGTAVLSDDVLAAVPGGERVAGATRFGTAAEVAGTLWAGEPVTGSVVVAIDQADSWQTALAAAPLSAALAAPQVGVAAGVAPAESIAAASALGGELTVVGSPNVVAPSVAAAVAAG